MMRVICQFKILTIIVLSFFVLSVKGQVYQSMPQYGYSGPRFNMDSTLSIPTVCGVPTLKSNLIKKAAIAFDSCNGVFYQYNPKTLAWSQITGGGGVSRAVDTIYRTPGKDSIQFTIGGKYYSIKDSSGIGVASRLVTSVYNNSGATITKGSIVYINGRHSSNLPTIALAQANTETNSYSTFAMVQDDILNNNSGIVIQAGNISNLNLPTSTYTDGQLVYLSPSIAGGITTIKPLAPYHIVKIGTITRAHPTLGSIELKIENGWQLDELSDVKISLVPSDYSVLQFRRTDSLWHDITLSNVIGSKVDTIYKVSGKDSIIFTINNKRYAIKDSVSSVAGYGNTGAMLYNQSGYAYGNDSLRYSELYNTFFVDAGLTINASKGVGSTKGIFINNLSEQNGFNNVLAYDNSTGAVGYKPFSATSAGTTDNIQFKAQAEAGGGFQASYDFVYTASEDAGYTNRLGIGTSNPIGKEHINYSTSDYTNTNGENTHLFLSNPSSTGQTSIYSTINEYPVAKWRTDYVGNINWVAYEGNQYFWTGGDYPDGTYKMVLWNDGNVGIGESISNGGYRFQVNGESYFYNPDGVKVCTIESNASHPIQILTSDENLNGTFDATKGSIGNSPDGLYENTDGAYSWRKLLRPYRSYVAQLSQSDTDAPIATILENDLGYTPTWSRVEAGNYQLSSTELSNENSNKVVVFLTIGNPYATPMETGYNAHASWNREENVIVVTTAYYDGNSTIPGFQMADDLLSDGNGDDFWRASIEIRIYD